MLHYHFILSSLRAIFDVRQQSWRVSFCRWPFQILSMRCQLLYNSWVRPRSGPSRCRRWVLTLVTSRMYPHQHPRTRSLPRKHQQRPMADWLQRPPIQHSRPVRKPRPHRTFRISKRKKARVWQFIARHCCVPRVIVDINKAECRPMVQTAVFKFCREMFG